MRSPNGSSSSASVFLLLLGALLALVVAGCATANVNPAQAQTNTGYVDFRAISADPLSWEVARFDEGDQSFHRVFSKAEPPAGGCLRLRFVPGSYRLRITFLNRVVAKPAEVTVEVQDGKITPVQVTLTTAGVASVRTEETRVGNTARGYYGRSTRIGSDETTMFDLTAVAGTPMPYQVKEPTSDAP